MDEALNGYEGVGPAAGDPPAEPTIPDPKKGKEELLDE